MGSRNSDCFCLIRLWNLEELNVSCINSVNFSTVCRLFYSRTEQRSKATEISYDSTRGLFGISDCLRHPSRPLSQKKRQQQQQQQQQEKYTLTWPLISKSLPREKNGSKFIHSLLSNRIWDLPVHGVALLNSLRKPSDWRARPISRALVNSVNFVGTFLWLIPYVLHFSNQDFSDSLQCWNAIGNLRMYQPVFPVFTFYFFVEFLSFGGWRCNASVLCWDI